MSEIILKPKEDIRIRHGHPWIYDNEIARVEGDPAPGDEVEIKDARGLHVGYAFFNPNSKIRARVYSRTAKHADREFFVRSFEHAKAWRELNFGVAPLSLRLVFGEADSVPGLIVDGFWGVPIDAGKSATPDVPEQSSSATPPNAMPLNIAAPQTPQSADTSPALWLSVQFLSLGVEVRKSAIVEALRKVFNPKGIVERSDAPVRALEGLPESTGVLWGSVPERILMEESGALFEIDLAGGQKTGWYLDQRANRRAAAHFAPGRSVLDMFCNQGGFSILAARAGASSVISVDSSSEALDLVRTNAARNGVADRITTVEANAFDYLRDLEKMGRRFNLIILDPPAFAKNRAALPGAYRGYKELNVRAMHLLERGGILVTFSCSHAFMPTMFDSMLAEAAFDSNRRLRLIEERTQDLDHPIMVGYEESRYLKGRIMQVL